MSGHDPDEVAIVYSGLRPGEKLFEELLAVQPPTPIRRLRIARLDKQPAQIKELLMLASDATDIEGQQLRQHLSSVITENRAAIATTPC